MNLNDHAVTKSDVAQQFGRNAAAYASSATHASGADLRTLLGFLDLDDRMDVLDVATGAGHTACALAPLVHSVTAIDLAPEMIAETGKLAARRKLTNVTSHVMDCEHLDFPDNHFDIVTCRIAPHHFIDVQRAVLEISRVLKLGGRLGLEDSISLDDRELDEFINRVEKLRDPTHIRSYSLGEWQSFLEAAGLTIVQWEIDRKPHDIAEWIERSGIDAEAVDRVYAAFERATPRAREHFEITYADERAVQFLDDKVILRADKH